MLSLHSRAHNFTEESVSTKVIFPKYWTFDIHLCVHKQDSQSHSQFWECVKPRFRTQKLPMQKRYLLRNCARENEERACIPILLWKSDCLSHFLTTLPLGLDHLIFKSEFSISKCASWVSTRVVQKSSCHDCSATGTKFILGPVIGLQNTLTCRPI